MMCLTHHVISVQNILSNLYHAEILGPLSKFKDMSQKGVNLRKLSSQRE